MGRRRFPRLLLVAAVLLALAVAVPAQAEPYRDVTGMSLHTGTAWGGQWMTIWGHHLGRAEAVFFGSHARATRLQIVSDSKLVVRTPNVGTDLRTHVYVWFADLSHTPYRDPQAGFQFVAAPQITALSPRAGPVSGTRVYAYGHDFRAVRSVTIDGRPVPDLHLVRPSVLWFTAPAHAAGSGWVRVQTAYGLSMRTGANLYRWVDRPVVQSISPDYGPATSPGTALIYGEHLAGASGVYVDGRPASIQHLTDAALSFTMPAHAAGTVHIAVRTPGGTSMLTRNDLYTYTRPNQAAWTHTALDTYRGRMQGVSCPTTTFCAAVDSTGAYVRSGATWGARVALAPFLQAVSCSSSRFCLAVGSAVAFTFADGAWTGTTAPVPDYLTGVSCPADGDCVAWDSRGQAFEYTGAAWSSIGYPTGGHLVTSISCAFTTECVATGWSTDAYRWDGHAWTPEEIDPDGAVLAVSCSGPSLCAALDATGHAVTWDGTAWSSPAVVFTDDGGGTTSSISCTPTGGCAAVDGEGYAAHFDGTGWTTTADPLVHATLARYRPPVLVGGVSCSSATTCTAVSGAGQSIDYSNGSWAAPAMAFETTAWADAVSCPTATFCAMSDADGDLFTWDGTQWSAPQRPVFEFATVSAVSCTSPSFCVMVAPDGATAVFDGHTWTAGPARAAGDASVSCVTTTFCVTPTGRFDGQSWTALEPPAVGTDPSVSCAAVTFCMAVGSAHASVFDGTGWGPAMRYDTHFDFDGGADRVSCPQVAVCVAVTGTGYQSTYTGGGWSIPVQADYYLATHGVSCATATFCERIDGNSADDFDGTTFSTPTPVGPGNIALAAVSCPTPAVCVAAGYGDVYVGRIG